MAKDVLSACKKTRKIATKTLASTLQHLLSSKQKISEVTLRDRWLKELRGHPEIYLDGWYIPPPHGIGGVIGQTKNAGRLNYKSLRPREMWPKNNIFLGGKNNMVYVYSSMVDRKTNIAGDIGLSIYLGKDSSVKGHLKICLKINREIFDFIEIGKTYKEIYTFAQRKFKKYDVANDILSTSDPTNTNIGHTIPQATDKNMISGQRKFINSSEETKVQKGTIITIEPRLISTSNPNIPLSSFHSIVIVDSRGNKELIEGFDGIFKIVRMDYLL